MHNSCVGRRLLPHVMAGFL